MYHQLAYLHILLASNSVAYQLQTPPLEELYGWLGIGITLGGQRGAQHLKHSAASYLEKTGFLSKSEGEMCLGVVSWLGSQLPRRPEPRVQVSKCGIPVSPNLALEGMERLLEKLGDRSQAGPLLILDIILFLNFFQLSSSYQSVELLTPISLPENTHTHTTQHTTHTLKNPKTKTNMN